MLNSIPLHWYVKRINLSVKLQGANNERYRVIFLLKCLVWRGQTPQRRHEMDRCVAWNPPLPKKYTQLRTQDDVSHSKWYFVKSWAFTHETQWRKEDKWLLGSNSKLKDETRRVDIRVVDYTLSLTALIQLVVRGALWNAVTFVFMVIYETYTVYYWNST